MSGDLYENQGPRQAVVLHHDTPKSVSRNGGFADYAGMLDLASQLVTTGFLPASVKTPAQCLAIILTGQELGIGPMQALRCVSIVQGKPVLGADLQLALFKRDGGKAEWVVLDEKAAELHLTHRNGDEHRERYALEDAKAAGLLFKDNWKKFPKAMLRSRCITAGLKSVGYEPTSGVYDPEELGAEVVVNEALEENGTVVGNLESVARGAAADGVTHQPVASSTAGSNPAPAPLSPKGDGLSKGKQPLSQKIIDRLLKKAGSEAVLLQGVFTVTGTRPDSIKADTWPKVDVNQYHAIEEAIKPIAPPEAIIIEDLETRLLDRLKDMTLPAKLRVNVLAEYENWRDRDELTVDRLQEWHAALDAAPKATA